MPCGLNDPRTTDFFGLSTVSILVRISTDSLSTYRIASSRFEEERWLVAWWSRPVDEHVNAASQPAINGGQSALQLGPESLAYGVHAVARP
jgi:hypothetical protein